MTVLGPPKASDSCLVRTICRHGYFKKGLTPGFVGQCQTYTLLDARAVATWKVPTGMTSHVHAFDAREGGSSRISLTYDDPTGTGKTTAHTDTYHGRFVKLVTNEQVILSAVIA
jgi:hypothetical protein